MKEKTKKKKTCGNKQSKQKLLGHHKARYLNLVICCRIFYNILFIYICNKFANLIMYRKISHNILPRWARKFQVIRLLLSAQLTCQVELLLTQLRLVAEIFRGKFVERSLSSGLGRDRWREIDGGSKSCSHLE